MVKTNSNSNREPKIKEQAEYQSQKFKMSRIFETAAIVSALLHTGTNACRNLGQAGHTSISHPHAQFPKGYDIEDVVVANYCYREHNQSCPTCHNLGLLEYSCSFCIENTCEQETCGNKWDWLNNLEECRQRIVLEETYRVNLDRLSLKFNALIEANVEKFKQLDFVGLGHDDDKIDKTGESLEIGEKLMKNSGVIEMVRPSGVEASRPQQKYNDGKYPSPDMQLQVYCNNQTAEMRDLRCYHPCPKTDYKQYGTRCFSTCRLPPKDELSSFCIEPEVRTAIELYSSCAEDCNENNIHDFCFACPDGMKKKDCQCVKQEKIYWRDIFTRENRPAIMLLEY